jgi:hypothetical protein
MHGRVRVTTTSTLAHAVPKLSGDLADFDEFVGRLLRDAR